MPAFNFVLTNITIEKRTRAEAEVVNHRLRRLLALRQWALPLRRQSGPITFKLFLPFMIDLQSKMIRAGRWAAELLPDSARASFAVYAASS